jgi:hypothetical protein
VPQDALLSIISKAEALQAAMAAATSRSLNLALSPPRHTHHATPPAAAATAGGAGGGVLPGWWSASGQQVALAPAPQQQQQQQQQQQGWQAALSLASAAAGRADTAATAGGRSRSTAMDQGKAPTGTQHKRQAAAPGGGAPCSRRPRRSSSGSDSYASSRSGSSAASSSSGGSYSGSSSTDWTEMEDLEDLEDLLLQELFFAVPPPAAARAHSPTRDAATDSPVREVQDAAVGGSSGGGGGEAPRARQGDGNAAGDARLPRLSVQVLAVDGLQLPAGGKGRVSVTAVFRGAAGAAPGHLGLDPLLTYPTATSSSSSGLGTGGPAAGAAQGAGNSSAGLLEVCVAGPPELQQPLLPGDRPTLVVELWARPTPPSPPPAGGGAGATGSPAAAGRDPTQEQQLLGIVKVPLQAEGVTSSVTGSHQLTSVAPHMAHEEDLLAAGWYTIQDVLGGAAAGRLLLAVTQQPPAPQLASTHSSPGRTQQHQQQGEEGGGGVLLGVRHTFDVSLVSATGLPDGAALAAAGQAAPASRFMCYHFPGEPSRCHYPCCVACEAGAQRPIPLPRNTPASQATDCQGIAVQGSPSSLPDPCHSPLTCLALYP